MFTLEADFKEEKESLEKHLLKLIQNSKKKLRSLQFALDQCLKWPEKYHEGRLLQANLYRWEEGAHSLDVEDWEDGNRIRTIHFTTSQTRQQHIAERFNVSKRQRQALPKIQKEVDKTQARKENLENLLQSLQGIQTLEDLETFQKNFLPKIKSTQSAVKQVQKALPYREYWSSSGLQIWVGKKSTYNEILTFKLAHGSDFWLHVKGFSGSHVVIRCKHGKDPDATTIQEAAQLALFYSKGKNQESAEVLVTQRKYVSPLSKGSKNVGKVQVSKHKLMHVRLDPDCLEHLKHIQKHKDNI